MAYFGDATAHAAILGVALSLALADFGLRGRLAVALAMALTVTRCGRGYAMDTLLGVLAHSALAFGLVAVSFLSGIRIDLMAYLFGDILACRAADLAVIWGGAALVVGLIAWRWSGAADRDAERGTGLCQRHRPEARAADPDAGARHHGGGGDQGGGRAADRRHADHPRRRRAARCRARPRHGAHRRGLGAAAAVIGLRAAYVLRHARRPLHRLRRGAVLRSRVGAR
jgi:hypothetical protein